MGLQEQWILDDSTEERQKESSKITEECKEFSGLLFQLGNVLQVLLILVQNS